jgi:hypothetical protein
MRSTKDVVSVTQNSRFLAALGMTNDGLTTTAQAGPTTQVYGSATTEMFE